jgi:hypothetical protein
MNWFKKAALISSVVLLPVVGNTATEDQQIRVLHWPYDVPCDAIQKDGDGWKQIKTIIVANLLLRGNRFSHTGETAVWDQKCLGDEPYG